MDQFQPQRPLLVFQNGRDMVDLARYFKLGPLDPIVNDRYAVPQCLPEISSNSNHNPGETIHLARYVHSIQKGVILPVSSWFLPIFPHPELGTSVKDKPQMLLLYFVNMEEVKLCSTVITRFLQLNVVVFGF